MLTAAADPASLAQSMAQVLDNPELINRLRANGPATAQHYTWTAAAHRHLEIYAEVATAAPAI